MEKFDSISSFETGALNILHLKRLWDSTLRLLDNNAVEKLPEDNNLNRIVFDDLGLGRVDID